MLSIESEVLKRHFSFFEGRSILLFGYLQDNFADQLKQAKSVCRFSSYFDYAQRYQAVEFGLENTKTAEFAVYFWTKNKQECQYQLFEWLAHCKKGQQLLIVGENRSGVRSVEKMLSPFGEIAKIDSARRCGLYHFELHTPPLFEREKFWKSYRLPDLNIFSLPAVFSAAELDEGTKLLLSTFEKMEKQNIKGKVLDLGCGAGVIGASLKQRFPDIHLTMSDIHSMAIASSERTLLENQLSGQVIASDVFSHIHDRFDLIVSNPPFHDGRATNYQTVEALISQAKQHLSKGGELRLVANAFLPYPDLLDSVFGRHQVLAQSQKFKVYSAT